MKHIIYRDELTDVWIRYKYKVEADSEKDAIKQIEDGLWDNVQDEVLWDTAEMIDHEYLNENLEPIK